MAAETSIDGTYDLHNHNCFAYLEQLAPLTPETMLHEIFHEQLDLIQFFKDYSVYSEQISYANIYYQFLSILEEQLPKIRQYFSNDLQYNQWINTLYCSHNNILKTTFELIKGPLEARRRQDERPEQLVAKVVSAASKTNTKHQFTPQQVGSSLYRFWSFFDNNYKPMLTTSIPSTRHFRYTQTYEYPQELRVGTQAQFHNGFVRISPLFLEWLRVNRTSPLRITHVYFNLLGFDRNDFIERKEAHLSQALHQAETFCDNLIVITMPANRGLMNGDAYKLFEKEYAKDNLKIKKLMLDVALGKRVLEIQDFYISKQAKKLLYGVVEDGHNFIKEACIVKRLLRNSFKAMGISLRFKDKLSFSQTQAVWFHFNKYEFPNFVLKRLNPDTWNFSCKDAIDRGGVASAYYNLISSFGTTHPLSIDEFNQTLHAAAALVKGRGLNYQAETIWNAVDVYVDAQFDAIASNSKTSWLINWRNDNTPPERAKSLSYVQKILIQNKQLISLEQIKADSSKQKLLAYAQLMLTLVEQELSSQEKEGKINLLLDVISLSTQMALSPQINHSINLGKTLEGLSKEPLFMKLYQCIVMIMDYIAKLFPSVKGALYNKCVHYSQSNVHVQNMNNCFEDMSEYSQATSEGALAPSTR